MLTSEHRSRGDNEPTGEAMTLWGKIDPKQMGDRAGKAKPKELTDKLDKAKKRSALLSHSQKARGYRSRRPCHPVPS